MIRAKSIFVFITIIVVYLGLAVNPFKFDKKKTRYTFYRTSGALLSLAKFDYQFKTELQLPSCLPNNSSYCSAIWSQLTIPLPNEHPSTTAILVSISNISPTLGIYHGN